MPRHLIALFALLLIPTNAQALELGVQDDGRTTTAVTQDTQALNGSWTRTVAYLNQPGTAQRIRDAHEAGLKIMLTVGGTGTKSRRPSFTKALRFIDTLPRADAYSIDNEPDLDGIKASTYRRGWMNARRHLGSRLKWCDCSPHKALTFTAAALRSGPLPRHLEFATHPYQSDDPLAATRFAGASETCMGCLPRARRSLKKMGHTVSWLLTEFGYSAFRTTDAQAAWLWPRAIKQATKQNAKMLIAYTAQGQSWDTRPRPLAWCSMTLGRACPGAQRPDDHRGPSRADDGMTDTNDHGPAVVRHMDPIVQQMLNYAKE